LPAEATMVLFLARKTLVNFKFRVALFFVYAWL